MVSRLSLVVICLLAICGICLGQRDNLALQAHASASENQPGLPAELGNDGKEDTRWSGIPGHNSGLWYELDWTQMISIKQIVVKQYARYSHEWDVQIWDDAANDWRTIKHDGKEGDALPLVVLDTLDEAVTTTKLRFANISHGPSFNEVEVYSSATNYPPVLNLASDLRGNFVGMLCDSFGSSPIPGKQIVLTCQTNHGRVIETATSNAEGMFFAKMPLGLKGDVLAEFDGRRSFFPWTKFQRGITPLDLHQAVTNLSTGWKFQADPPAGFQKQSFNDATWKSIKVPAHWEMEGHVAKTGAGGYRLHFKAPAGTGRLMLRFDGVYSGADVWVNSTPVAKHLGGFTPFETDISSLIQPGDNVIAVRAVEHTVVSDQMDKMSQYADFGLGGIMRKVTLFRVPEVHVEGYEQRTLFAGSSAQIVGSVAYVNLLNATVKSDLLVTLVDSNGVMVANSKTPVNLGANDRTEIPISLTVKNPKGWNAEHPNLYNLKFQLLKNKGSDEALNQKIGIRETKVEGTRILINNTAVKFKGTCHHDQYPTMGRAVTPEIERLDLDMIKGANLNSLRTSHYPPLPELIDYADKIGLYVEDEADFCWVGVANDLRNTPQIIQLTGEMVARDRNHPSVFIWSIANESEYGTGFERSHEWVRKIDSSRPTSAATTADLEIATLHNPISIARMNRTETLDRPLLFDEAWCIYQGIWGDVNEMWVDPGIRDYYVEPLKGIWDVFLKSKVTQGSQIWAWSDDLFCVPGRGPSYGRGTTQNHFVEREYTLPGRGIVGDAPWGVVDGWRREKPEYWYTKHLQSSIRVDEHPYIPGEPTPIKIYNDYDFTNLSEINFTYSFGKETFVLPVAAAPHGVAEYKIPGLKFKESMVLSVYGKDGKLIDRWTFATKPTPPWNSNGPALSITDVPMLAGNTLSVDGSKFHLSFDRDAGFLRECFAGGEPTLLEFPSIHVLPSDSPTREIPDRNSWHADEVKTWLTPQKDFRAIIRGTYQDFKGKYEITITRGGTMTCESEFEYTGKNVLAREIGMRFSVPKGCDILSWNRNPEFGYLPDNHIGRAIGTAHAHSDHKETVPPQWGFANDNSPMGSNDFRSTKRHFYFGSIRYANGAGVGILSDGKQALRAIVDSDRISVHISDWYGGTNVGLGEWVQNYGRGKEIKTGEILKSTIRLELLLRSN